MTRTTMIAALAISAAAGLATTANAGNILLNETFTYPDGNLVPNGGWANHSGTGSFIQVTGGAAIVSHGTLSREDANRQFTAVGAGQTVYAAFDFSNSGDALAVYFAHLMVGVTTTFASRAWIMPPTAGGDYTIGYSDTSTAPTGGALWASDLTFGTTYRAVMAYEFDTGASRLWINPTLEGDTNLAVAGVASRALSGVALRQAGTFSTQTIDNLIIGDSFAAVVPAPGTLALLGLGGLVATRRRRA